MEQDGLIRIKWQLFIVEEAFNRLELEYALKRVEGSQVEEAFNRLELEYALKRVEGSRDMRSTFKEITQALSTSLLTDEELYTKPIEECIEVSAGAIQAEQCIFVCGNGGSAATAAHIANDMMCHMKNWNRKGYRIMSLVDNVSAITSLTNDYGFDQVFSRQIAVFGNKGDVLWAFSTSGNSKNCVVAIEKAKELGITTVGLTGKSGGKMKDLCDIWIPVASDEVTRVEELHMIYAHIIGENVEAIVSP